MIRKTIAFLSLGLALLVSSSANVQASPGTQAATVTYDAGTFAANNYNIGFDFTASTAITITSLGAYNPSGTLVPGQTVYLYDVTASSQVDSESVPTSGLTTGFNFGSATLTDTLIVGHVYSVYTQYSSSYENGTISLASGLTNVTPSGSSNGNQGLFGSYPSVPTISYNVIGANFTFVPAGAIPEPASIAMMGLGLAGVVLVRRKMVKKSA